MEMTGLKTKFQREGAMAGTYTDVAQVANITPPQPEREVVDIEDLDPADEIKRKLPSLIDAGEVSLTLNFDPAETSQTTLEADFYAGDVHNYRILLPNNYAWTFPAFISGWAPSEITAGDVLQVEVTFTVTGKPTLAPVV
ncbi:MAG: phage tail tube protein [Bacillota bacterium]